MIMIIRETRFGGIRGMNADELEELVISTVQETQVKLGPADGSESLYLPLTSLEPDGDIEAVRELMEEFQKKATPHLGKVDYTIMQDRVRMVIPEKGTKYVSGLPVSPVLMTMVDSVSKHLSLDQLKTRLESEFGDCTWKDVDGDEFRCIAYFDRTDPNVYCIGSECGHLIYHRFNRKDYSEFGYGM